MKGFQRTVIPQPFISQYWRCILGPLVKTKCKQISLEWNLLENEKWGYG
jgi:hypothetical protein